MEASDSLPAEVLWLLQPSQHSYVRQQNELVEARYCLTARELKMVLYACAMVDPNADNFGQCQIRVRDFAELAGIESRHLHMELRDIARSIRSKELILDNVREPGEERPRRKYLSWFIDVSVDPNGDGCIGVTLHPDLKPYLLQVHRNYTRFQLGYAVRLDSKYAIRLYQILQRWAFTGKKRVTIDELRLQLGTRELSKSGEVIRDSLPAYKSLKQRALTPALEEINQKSDLSVSFTEEKEKGSKAILALNFRIRRNLETADRLGAVKPAPRPQLELEMPEMAGEAGEQDVAEEKLRAIVKEFGLSARQAEALADYSAHDGVAYVEEKAALVRSRPTDNAARAFIAALRDDWKSPVAILKKAGETNLKPKFNREPPTDWQNTVRRMYPSADLPDRFWNLPESVQQEVWHQVRNAA